MTVCNMSIEAGARAGLIAPGRRHLRVPRGPARRAAGADWERALERWRSLRTDAGAAYDARGAGRPGRS